MRKSLGAQLGHRAMERELVHDAPTERPSKNSPENQALDEGELVLRVKTCFENRDFAKKQQLWSPGKDRMAVVDSRYGFSAGLEYCCWSGYRPFVTDPIVGDRSSSTFLDHLDLVLCLQLGKLHRNWTGEDRGSRSSCQNWRVSFDRLDLASKATELEIVKGVEKGMRDEVVSGCDH